MARGDLNITYREPDLQIDDISLSNANPMSGETITVTWTATNRGTRDLRTNTWFDGLYLSLDDSLDSSDYPLVNPGNNQAERQLKVHLTNPILTEDDGVTPRTLRIGESYTQSATFALPESISGSFKLIVKADTNFYKDYYNSTLSSIRDGLDVIDAVGYAGGMVAEFKDEGNNVASTALTINLATPPDLQVASVTTANSVLAGQSFTVNYSVTNAGGNTPSDQGNWYDLIYLSKDRFLDVNQDRYLGYVNHSGGLAGGASYNGSLTVNAPRDFEGPYYPKKISWT